VFGVSGDVGGGGVQMYLLEVGDGGMWGHYEVQQCAGVTDHAKAVLHSVVCATSVACREGGTELSRHAEECGEGVHCTTILGACICACLKTT
jgi:hypothetical protein